MTKKYEINLTRIRVDLGDDMFVDAEVPNYPIFEADTIKKIVLELKRYIRGKKGEVVEFFGKNLSFDTPDLTVYLELGNSDG